MMQQLTPQNMPTIPDEDITVQVACYGILWDPKDSQCSQECFAYARCAYRLATATLPQIASEAGLTTADHTAGTLKPNVQNLTMEQVADHFEMFDYSVEYAKAINADPNVGLPVIQANGQLAPSGKWPHIMPFQAGLEVQMEGSEVLEAIQKGVDVSGEVEVGEIGEDGKMVSSMHQIGEASVASELVSSSQASIEQVIEESSAADVTFGVDDSSTPETPVAKTKKRVAKKKTPTKKKVTKKVTKKSITKTPTKKAATVNPPKAPKSKKSSQSWGPTTFQARFNKDQTKPPIQKMVWGEKIQKKFQGETHTVQFTKKGWEYKEDLYPTLYSVMCKIKEPKEYPAQLTQTGVRPEGKRTMASMSALRFFGLEKRR